MRLARNATQRALAVASRLKEKGAKHNPLAYDVLLYTDCATAATYFIHQVRSDLADICGVSRIEDIAIIMGENFPIDSEEALRWDNELPRVAAMLFPALHSRCARCWKYVVEDASDICTRCEKVLNQAI